MYHFFAHGSAIVWAMILFIIGLIVLLGLIAALAFVTNWIFVTLINQITNPNNEENLS